MIETRKNWQVSPVLTAEADHELHTFPPILRQILFNRGFATQKTASRYLQAEPPENTDPFNLLGVQDGAKRIEQALRNDEQFVVYGDYDVDGVTSAALLYLYLSNIGANVSYYIPDRFREGYGLNKGALTTLAEDGVDLVITVDCGIRSIEEAKHARASGLDLIITDHHHPGEELPKAVAVIDPKQPDDKYPEKDLAGVGIAFKLAAALDMQLENTKSPAESYLDLVALGTVADLAPLTGENRFLVRHGLKQLQLTKRQGLISLMGVAGVNPAKITASDIGFLLGPRLNAAGRLDHARTALDLLTTHDVFQAGRISQQLEMQNRERQKLTNIVQAQAEELALSTDPGSLLLFAVHPDFNAGVVGLAASRLTEQFYRPAVVGQIEDDVTRASCRSIAEFHITEALDRCSDLLVQYGGHAAAAGFTVKNENLIELSERLRSLASEELGKLELTPTLVADVEIPLSDLNHDLLEQLSWMQPTGYGNPPATFVSRNLRVTSYRTVGRDNAHLKLSITDGWITFDAIAFRQGDWAKQMPQKIDLLYRFELNEFNGRKILQLNVQDIRAST